MARAWVASSLHDGGMPGYRWTCCACGAPNAAQAEACAACACPARPTVADIVRCRDGFLQQGGRLQGDAAVDARPELSACAVLIRPALAALLSL